MKHICVEGLFSVFCNRLGICRVLHFRLSELNSLMRYPSFSVFVQYLSYLSSVWCGESVGERRFTLPVGCFPSPLEGGRTHSALGMCVDTHYPDHVMAWSPCSPSVTFRVSNTHLIGQQNACKLWNVPWDCVWTAWAPSEPSHAKRWGYVRVVFLKLS